MPDPTYNNLAIFGPAPAFRPALAPPRWQLNTYPGVNGLEALFLGTSGGVTQVDGVLVGVDTTDLVDQENVWRAFESRGQAYTLIDALGVGWDNVIVADFQAAEEVKPWGVPGTVSRRYTATLLHLG